MRTDWGLPRNILEKLKLHSKIKKFLPIQIGKQQSCKSRTHFFQKLYALFSKKINHNCIKMFKSMKFNFRSFFDSFIYCYYLRDGSSSLASQLAGEFIVELRLHSTHLSNSGTHIKSSIPTASDPSWILLDLCKKFSNNAFVPTKICRAC
jgi:hypothetical protein